jgi:alpha-1,3-glucan synthase
VYVALFLDKFVNGDPRNDDANGTVFEHDVMGNQLRHGGDLKGLVNSLDYLHGLGIKVCLLPCINMRDACHRIAILLDPVIDDHRGSTSQEHQ